MADKKISELVSLAGKDVAATDLFPVVDVSVAEIKSLTRDELRNAVNAIQFAATKALATTAAASLPDDTIIEVAADESLSGAKTRYKVASGALVFAYGVVTKADLAASSGAGLVGWIQSGLGAVLRYLQDKLYDVPHVFDYMTQAEIADVRSGVPTLDHSAAIAKALAAHSAPSFGAWPNKFRVSQEFILSDYQEIRSWGARIQQLTAQKPIFVIAGKTGTRFHGTRYIGGGTDYVDSSSSLALAISGSNAIDTVISWNTFTDFAYSPFYGEGVSGFMFAHNKVIGPGLSVLTPGVSRNNTGVTVGGTGINISHNDITLTGQGLIVAQGSSNAVVTANVLHDILVEHGMYFDTGLNNIAVTGNVLTRCHQNGIKFQWYDSYGVTPKNITVTGNVVDTTTTGDGIVFNNSVGGTICAKDVVVAGNSISNVGQDGLSMNYLTGAVVAGNTVDITGRRGATLRNLNKSNVHHNTISSTNENGIFANEVMNDTVVEDNKLFDLGLSNIAAGGRNSAIFTATTSEVGFALRNNRVNGNAATTKYGIYLSSGVIGDIELTGNSVINVSDCGLRLYATGPMGAYSGNQWDGLLSPTFNQPTLPVIASAATITIPKVGKVFIVSGTTNVTAIISSGSVGRRITLIFQDVLTMTDGASMYLAGSFVTSANDTLTLVSDGNYWYEVCRSAN